MQSEDEYMISKTLKRVTIVLSLMLLPLILIYLSLSILQVETSIFQLKKALFNTLNSPIYSIILIVSFYTLLVIYDYIPSLPYTFKKNHKIPENMLTVVSLGISLPIIMVSTYKISSISEKFIFINNITEFSLSITIISLIGFSFYYDIIDKKYKNDTRYNYNFLLTVLIIIPLSYLYILNLFSYNTSTILALIFLVDINLLRRFRYLLIEDNVNVQKQKLWNITSRVPFLISVILSIYSVNQKITFLLLFVPFIITIIYMLKR